MRHQLPEIGRVFEVPYPFIKDRWIEHYNGEDGPMTNEIPTWRPGTRFERWAEADAMGTQILTVISVHKPGRFPTRVFYTRQWRDPDGKTFGKTKCRITTVPAFMTLIAGYRVAFELSECEAGR